MRAIHRVSLESFLSFREATVELSDLTVLVGPNGSGKTNFLRVFQFIGQMARTDLGPAILAFGGQTNIAFRGPHAPKYTKIELEGVMTSLASNKDTDTYRIEFDTIDWPPGGGDEEDSLDSILERNETFFFKRTKGRGRRITLKGRDLRLDRLRTTASSSSTGGADMEVRPSASGLALLRRLGTAYEAPQVDELARIFEGLRLFEVDVPEIRRPSSFREPQRLAANGSNVAAYLNWLRIKHPGRFAVVEEDVRHVLPSFEGFVITRIGGADDQIRLDIKERHLKDTTPLARTSFGTIRSIALFAMLQDPEPPRLTCLEEVDHGLHPHALDRLVQRMRQASRRTQIIVATHSPALVNRLRAEELVVFEREPETGATRVPDITADDVEEMQQASGMRLGELWFSGMLGDLT